MTNQIGNDLRRLWPDGTPGSVAACHLIRRAMGINEGKLPEYSVPRQRVGDTIVYVMSRHAVTTFNSTHRPHRMFAICNHCSKHVPTGRFGQHLKIHEKINP